MVTRIAVVALAITVISGSGHAWAQTDSRARRGRESGELSRLEARLRDRDRVRVRTGSRWVELWHPVLREGTISYAGSAGAPASAGQLSLADVSQIQFRGSAAGTGARVGALVGGISGLVGGAVGGVALANWCLWGNCPDASSGSELALGAMGGALGFVGGMGVGALVGAVTGWPIKKWKTIYRVEPSRGRSPGIAFAVGF